MIERVDPDRITDADIAAWHECRAAIHRSDHPGEPPPTSDKLLSALAPGVGTDLRVWLARDSAGRVVGEVNLALFEEENPHLAHVIVRVRPDARRSGLGRDLADVATRVVAESGRTVVIANSTDRPGPVGFAEALGYHRNLTLIRRVLDAPANRDRIARYAAGDGARTDGFGLVRWANHCPDELLDAAAAVREAMNDTPRGDLDLEPTRWTGERVRELEAVRVVARRRVRTLAVVENATGAVAGYTEVVPWPGSRRAEQAATAVSAAFRGRGFGLWLKAAMIEWLRTECPEVTEYETWNSDVNPHMIAVNERLGYRAVDTWIGWGRALDGSGR